MNLLANKQPDKSWGKAFRMAAILVLLLVAYVFLYPVWAILDYFNYINSDHGVGRVLYILFMPLGNLEQHSEAIRPFFKWLIDLLMSPFL